MFLRGPPCSLLWVSVIAGQGRDDNLLTASLSLSGRPVFSALHRSQKYPLNTWVSLQLAISPGTESRSPLPEPPVSAWLPYLCHLFTLHLISPVPASLALPNLSAWNPPPQGPPVAPRFPRTALHSKHIPIRGLPWHPSITIPPSHFLAFIPLYFS